MDEALREVLLADERIAYALLFGSMARGDTTPSSDVDVAIGLRSGATFDLHDIGGLIFELQRAVGRDVDVVILNEAPPGLAYRIFRDGRLLVEKDRRARVERQVRAILDYLDYEWVERRCTRGVLERAARG
ncbi:MAG TPA: nucleotidyltransferase domain-containing protein [Thermoanaerobaculia bacterium]|jgi:predicted nucleotidyltransferase